MVLEGGDGVEMNPEDSCVREVCNQNGHGLTIKLPLAYVDSKGVECRTYSGDDDGHGDG